MTPDALFQRYWTRALRLIGGALVILGALLALALYLILA